MPPKKTAAKRKLTDTKNGSTAKDLGAGESPDKKPRKQKTPDSQVESGAADYLKDLDFSSSAVTKDGQKWKTKIISVNVNGFRAFVKKAGLEYIKKEAADVFCIQETKCTAEEVPSDGLSEAGYSLHFLSADKSGYSGVGVIYKNKPLKITDGINVEEHDKEGRVITLEYDSYYLVTTYVPNSGRGLPRLDYRTKEWDEAFKSYLTKLDKEKPVILCGDLNVAHEEIDLKNPKSNKNKTPGFCDAEREGFSKLLSAGFVDTFRHLYPDKKDSYTFWSYMGNSRSKNVGWRLDYFLLSQRLEDRLCDSVMRSDVMGSDHCPIGLFVDL